MHTIASPEAIEYKESEFVDAFPPKAICIDHRSARNSSYGIIFNLVFTFVDIPDSETWKDDIG